MKQFSGIIAAILFGAALTQPAKANAIFDFSFSNITGNVPGTVTGYVVLPNSCSPCAAIDVVLTGFPAGLDNPYGGPPIDVTTTFTTVSHDTFTVNSGVVTAVEYAVSLPSAESSLVLGHINALQFSDTGYTGNQDGLVSFTAAVPEPNSVILMSTALLAVAWVARRRNARGRSPATRTNR
jgi:hypothetical protein